MPLEIDRTANKWVVGENFVSPTVYMDHWAIRLFSDDLRLQDLFVRTLARKRGTLVLSHISVHEFQRPMDDQHSESAERFLERMLPDLYFTDVNFAKMLAQERAERDNRKRFPAPPDALILNHLAELANAEGRLTVRGLLTRAHAHRGTAVETINQSIRELRTAIRRAGEDPLFVAKARRARRDRSRLRTMIIVADLLRQFILDRQAELSDNDAIDLIHAVIPVNCCDYVLLDGPWYERVRAMQRQIEKESDPMPTAKCFSQRDNGIEAFLTDLANLPID